MALVKKTPKIVEPKVKRKVKRVDPSTTGALSAYYKFFNNYGIIIQDYDESRAELHAVCPYCEVEGSFGANCNTGLWKCFKCNRKGNTFQFIDQFAAFCLNEVLDPKLPALEYYEHLLQDRPGISAEILRKWKVCYNPLNECWMLPAWSSKNVMNNLYQWIDVYDPRKQETEKLVKPAPTMKHVFYGINEVSREVKKPLWVCEGHWDFLAWCSALAKLKDTKTQTSVLKSCDVLAVPGAGTHPSDQLTIFANRDVRLLFDADEAGRTGVDVFKRALIASNNLPSKLSSLAWPTNTTKGFDIRDLIVNGKVLFGQGS
jgi:hypothetical protein